MREIRNSPARARLADGRWHFQHGPIDLIIGFDGAAQVCEVALALCWNQFQHVLAELVQELPTLRQPAFRLLASVCPAVTGVVARRMLEGCAQFAAERFITPMAAVAGAVADELIQYFRRPGIDRAFINNGGDIALHLASGQEYNVGIWPGAALGGLCRVYSHLPVRGVATSGWRGRSLSLGIADSVTVLAANAAAADAAATLIANAVNSEHRGILRKPANQIKDDTDLGDLPVTVQVPPLPHHAIASALRSGRAEARYWQARGAIDSAVIVLQGQSDVVARTPAVAVHERVA